jgi:putative ABC transport system permease protein
VAPRHAPGRLVRQLRLSARLLAAHPLRTLLSASGLAAGIATVMVMAALGRGAEAHAVQRVRALGSDLLIVTAAPAPQLAGRRRQVESSTLLRPADATALAEQLPGVRAAAAAVHRTLVVRADARTTSVAVTGTTPEGLAIRGIRAASGRLHDALEERERRRVAVLGPGAARTLFGDEDPVGRALRIASVPVEVIGVSRARGVDPNGAALDHSVTIPLETALRRVVNVPWVDALYVQGRGTAALDALESDVRALLLERHGARPGVAAAFAVRNQAVLLRTERAVARAIDRLTLSVSALTLAIGGTGVLAVMLLAVRERTREVGLRRALGARRADIRAQFLAEAVLLAAGGGVAGVALGALAIAVLARVGPWPMAVAWTPAWVSLAGSILLGLAAGVLPARRAARLEPVSALGA